jgi:hypothetical protein
MKFIASVIAFCCLFLIVSPAQVNPASSLQPTPLEAFAHQPATHVAWSKEVGRLDSRDAHAVVSVLILEDTAQPPDRMRGIRIELSDLNSKDEVYLGEETLGVYKSALDEISRNLPGFRKSARDNLVPGGISYLGACLFRYVDKLPRVHTLSAAYYFAPDSEGLYLSTFKNGGFRFADQDPLRLSAAIAAAIDQLKNQSADSTQQEDERFLPEQGESHERTNPSISNC